MNRAPLALGEIKKRLSFANVVSLMALWVALGGTSYAAIVITGKNVKNETLTSADVKNRSLLERDFKLGQLLAGPQGPAGPHGPAGPQGPAGARRPAGPDGAHGAKGETGATGPQGVPGPKGDTGAPGAKGDTGASGAKGDTGAPGAKGDTGAPGPKGDTGAPGAKGDTGAPGPKGDPGPSGGRSATGGAQTTAACTQVVLGSQSVTLSQPSRLLLQGSAHFNATPAVPGASLEVRVVDSSGNGVAFTVGEVEYGVLPGDGSAARVRIASSGVAQFGDNPATLSPGTYTVRVVGNGLGDCTANIFWADTQVTYLRIGAAD